MGKWSVPHPRKRAMQAVCAQCSAQFEVPMWKVAQGKGRYCSTPCYRRGSRVGGVEYDGKWFGRSGKNPYFWWKRPDKTAVSLHRYVWEKHNCPVPEGHVVHHIDHDPANNDISNLQLMSDSEHARQHLQERLVGGDRRMLDSLAKAREAARLWHKSPEGLLWHKEQGERLKGSRQKVRRV